MMIEFKGELTDNTLKFLKKRMIRSRQKTNIFFLIFGLPMLTFLLHFIIPLKYITIVFFSFGNFGCFYAVSYNDSKHNKFCT